MQTIEMTGKVFGRLEVLCQGVGRTHGEARWHCKCVCGAYVDVPGSRLRKGHTTSCGCYKRSRIGDLSRTHGKSKTLAYVMYYDACKRARARGQSVSITPEDICIPDVCPVLGIPLISGAGLRSPNTPTLDCINPALGYVPGNVMVVSWRFNKVKGDLTPTELQRIARWVLR